MPNVINLSSITGKDTVSVFRSTDPAQVFASPAIYTGPYASEYVDNKNLPTGTYYYGVRASLAGKSVSESRIVAKDVVKDTLIAAQAISANMTAFGRPLLVGDFNKGLVAQGAFPSTYSVHPSEYPRLANMIKSNLAPEYDLVITVLPASSTALSGSLCFHKGKLVVFSSLLNLGNVAPASTTGTALDKLSELLVMLNGGPEITFNKFSMLGYDWKYRVVERGDLSDSSPFILKNSRGAQPFTAINTSLGSNSIALSAEGRAVPYNDGAVNGGPDSFSGTQNRQIRLYIECLGPTL